MTRPSALVACLVAVVLGGCQATVTGESGEAKPVEESGPAMLEALPGPKPQGRFYAVVRGESPNDDQLYELRLSPPELRLLSPTKRVSSVGACDRQVVVAAAQEEVGFADHLQLLEGEKLVPLDGIGPVAALGPAVAPDCRVAYTQVDRSGPVLVAELKTWDPQRGVGKTLYRVQPGDGLLLGTTWGPNGEVATLRLGPDPDAASGAPAGKGRPPAIIVVRPDGSSSEVDPGTPDPVGLTWGKTAMAIGDGEARTILLDPANGKRSTVEGWRPLAWSPEGDVLLVKDSASGSKLGVVDLANPSSIQEFARLTGPVFDVDWLPAQ